MTILEKKPWVKLFWSKKRNLGQKCKNSVAAKKRMTSITKTNPPVKLLSTAKVCSEIKETTFQVGHLRTISGHSIANYINIFHKTEVI